MELTRIHYFLFTLFLLIYLIPYNYFFLALTVV